MLHATGELVGTTIVFLGILFLLFIQFVFKGTKLLFNVQREILRNKSKNVLEPNKTFLYTNIIRF
jgi:hypothetical protein